MREDRKNEIIQATIRLIQDKGSHPDAITVREICKEAGVGVGIINYYFESKDNLIAQCVQQIIGNVIAHFGEVLAPWPTTSAMGRLKYAANATVTFLYGNENISRISILSDLRNGRAGDNTEQTIAAYLPLVEAVCRERQSQRDAKQATVTMCMVLQGAFLRTERIQAELGIDMRNPEERKRYVDGLIDGLFEG
ncbi:transcriptional regulator [Longilinea arvoryzae]|uniref:Transcriptional regulator n=1 Tax=Longilinea arvoryzae TaxID=360412 RepID=A0A0K8MZJ7_9CHLR|nr:TetR/AcrR family transcriptional regulator [Longilinea arvoryzae]GAP16067.1 transcriptional regulator [Longilinea arvoryzae]